MATPSGHEVIAIEEHYWDPALVNHYAESDATGGAGAMRPKLEDLCDERIAEMDSAGIDIQVLSHGAPSTQRLDPSNAAGITRNANDRLQEVVAERPDRFAAFGNLPTPDPEACADELIQFPGLSPRRSSPGCCGAHSPDEEWHIRDEPPESWDWVDGDETP